MLDRPGPRLALALGLAACTPRLEPAKPQPGPEAAQPQSAPLEPALPDRPESADPEQPVRPASSLDSLFGPSVPAETHAPAVEAVIARDDAEVESEYLTDARTRPDRLTVTWRSVREGAPRPRREQLADALSLDPEAPDDKPVELEGIYLDPARRRFLTRIQFGAFEAVYLVFDPKGRRQPGGLSVPLRNRLLLRDLVGDDELEVIVEVVLGDAMSTYPRQWRVFKVISGRLEDIGHLPKSYSTGSKRLSYRFLNRIEVLPHDELLVETIVFDETWTDPPHSTTSLPFSPKSPGEQRRWRYDQVERELRPVR